MKTTIDIADNIMAQSQQVAQAGKMTFRDLVEEGLLMVIDRRATERVVPTGNSLHYYPPKTCFSGTFLSRSFALLTQAAKSPSPPNRFFTAFAPPRLCEK
jgi:hypothetical protein